MAVDFSSLLKGNMPAATEKALNTVAEEQQGHLAPSETALLELDAGIEDDSDEMSLSSIYRELSIHEDIILIIDKCDEIKIRKGLSAIKAKEVAKLKDNGIATDAITLEFAHHPPIEGMVEGQLKLQVFFKRKGAVRIHKIIVPTKEL